MEKALQTLRKISYFAEIEENLQHELAHQATRLSVEQGQIVLLEGEQSEAVYVVESGWLKSSKSSQNGREHVIKFLGSGETFNELSVLIEAENQTTVTALEPSVLFVMRRPAIQRVLERHPELARKIIQRLAGRVQFLLSMIEDLSLRSIEARLARYLVEQASDNHMLYRPKWATQAELANHLGTVPNVLNRSLKNLEQANLIAVKRHQIEIIDLPALTERALLDK